MAKAKFIVTPKVVVEEPTTTQTESQAKTKSKLEMKVLEMAITFDPNRIAAMLGMQVSKVREILSA